MCYKFSIFLTVAVPLRIPNPDGVPIESSDSSTLSVIFIWFVVVCGECPGAWEWECLVKNQCIRAADVCDGVQNCEDGTDEIFSTCANITCVGHAFRCGYGACVDGDAPCNGKLDCVDKSDELLSSCKGVISQPPSHNCGELQFPCLDGRQCIPSHELCDGFINCEDKSDETITQCASFKCPAFAFRCAYGACVDGDAACNGDRDCADGSDEYASQCNVIAPLPSSPENPTDVDVPVGPGGKCISPNPLQNGFYCVDDVCQPIAPGTVLPVGSRLSYECHKGYKLLGEERKTCTRGGWSPPHPTTCTDECEPLKSTKLSLQCFTFDYKSVPCNQKLPPNAFAKFSCKSGVYELAQDFSYNKISCHNGDWNRLLPENNCQPACGKAVMEFAQPAVAHGTPVEQNKIPWHAGIYSYQNETRTFEHICGGSLISKDIVLSAAHCFKIEQRGTTELLDRDPSLMRVALGKLLRVLFSKDRDMFEQIFQIKRVAIPQKYEGSSQLYVADIAVVILQRPVEYNLAVLPVCLDIGPAHQEDEQLLPGNSGLVVGWGRTEHQNFSSKLLMTTMPYVPRDVCKQSSALHSYVTYDKLCAGDPSSGTTVCSGDSGGGLVFKNQKTRRYILRGIVSSGKQGCVAEDYSIFTRVSKHADFINPFL